MLSQRFEPTRWPRGRQATSTATLSLPGLLTWSVREAGARSTACAGDTVSAGDTLFILEVMKTEVPHTAGESGTVKAVHIKEEDSVDAGVPAVDIG